RHTRSKRDWSSDVCSSDLVHLSEISTNEILGISTAIEAFSQHPLASAITRKAEKEKVDTYKAENFQSITGKGAKATVEGTAYFIGNTILYEVMTIIQYIYKQNIENVIYIEEM